MHRTSDADRYAPAAREVLKRYPIEVGDLEFIVHTENVTFRVSSPGSGPGYALRLHRPGYNSLRELESERDWTRALAEAGHAVPESVRSHNGRDFECVEIPATGERRQAGLTRWIEGSPLREVLESLPDAERTQRFRDIGELTASLHDQSQAWTPPPGFRRRRLDVDGLLGSRPLWGRFWEHPGLTRSERDGLLRARRQLRTMLLDYGEPPDRFGLIHADLHPSNILSTGQDLAVIDFDDAGFGWHLYDLATTLVEERCSPDFDALRTALLQGYERRRPLSPQDLELLPGLMLIRGMAIIGWCHQRAGQVDPASFEEVKRWLVAGCETL